MHPEINVAQSRVNDDETEAIVAQSRVSAETLFEQLRNRRELLTLRRSNLAEAIDVIDTELGAVHTALAAFDQDQAAQSAPSAPSHAYAVN